MALHPETSAATGSSIGYSIRRLSDRLLYDFSDGNFKSNPITGIQAITESSGNYAGTFGVTLTPTPTSQFPDGFYRIYFHDLSSANVVLDISLAQMSAGDDLTIASGTGGGGTAASPSAIASAVWRYAIEHDINAGQALDIILAVSAALVQGIGTTNPTVVVRQPAPDTSAVADSALETRLAMAIDANGNRSSAVLTPNAALE
jgi:hypothetical protein